MKVLVNTVSTKKHAGGAFQVAINFLMKSLEYNNIEWFYITSQDIDNVIGKNFSGIKGIRYFVFPTQPDFRHSFCHIYYLVISLLKHPRLCGLRIRG